MFKKEQLDLLKAFTQACKGNPGLLHTEELAFFKEWLLSIGANIPPKPTTEEGPEESTEESTEAKGAEAEENDDVDMSDVPVAEEDEEPPVTEKENQSKVESDGSDSDSDVESDIDIKELDGIMTDENTEKLEMGDDSLEVTEEMIDDSNSKRSEAMSHLNEGNLEAAISSFTEAIKLNPHSANMYAKRASALIKNKRPAAAILDCEKAITINKDSAQPYKWRGRAYRLLGKYVNAYHDFQTACRLDFDETSLEWQKEVEANAKKIIEHNRKYERIHKEKDMKRKIKEAKRRKAKAEEEYERARKEESNKHKHGAGMPGGFPGGMPGGMGGFPPGMGGMPGGMPGGMGGMPGGMGGMPGGMGGMPGGMPGGMGGMPGGMGGMPGGMGGMPGGMGGTPGAAGGGGMPDLNALFSDPEIMTAMQDPEVMAAFQDVSKNPANMSKYENNPKIKNVIEKLQTKFGGSKMPGSH